MGHRTDGSEISVLTALQQPLYKFAVAPSKSVYRPFSVGLSDLKFISKRVRTKSMLVINYTYGGLLSPMHIRLNLLELSSSVRGSLQIITSHIRDNNDCLGYILCRWYPLKSITVG